MNSSLTCRQCRIVRSITDHRLMQCTAHSRAAAREDRIASAVTTLLVLAILFFGLAVVAAGCGREPLTDEPYQDVPAESLGRHVRDQIAPDAGAVSGAPGPWCAACAADPLAVRVIVCDDGGCQGNDCASCPPPVTDGRCTAPVPITEACEGRYLVDHGQLWSCGVCGNTVGCWDAATLRYCVTSCDVCEVRP